MTPELEKIEAILQDNFKAGCAYGKRDALKELNKAIHERIEALDEQDAESHIWYGKFLELIDTQ